MEFSEFADIEDRLRKELDKNRYRHTLGVAHTAVCLSMRWGFDLNTAYLTGLLHDCAKKYKSKEQIDKARDFGIELTESELRNPQLIHAKTGAYLCEHEYGIKDEHIRNAIICHTTGKPGMDLLEKILYVSDYIEPNRTVMKRLGEIRKTAFCDLDRALFMILEDTVEYLNEKGADSVDPMTELTYNYYLKENA